MSFLTSRRVALVGAAAVVAHLAAALVFRDQRYEAGLVSNVGQAFVLLGILGLTVLCAFASQGRRRAFWAFMSFGVALWLTGQCHWIYFENIRHVQVPNPSSLDVIFFMHIVPMIAAASMQPHAETRPGDIRIKLGAFDFALLFLFWVFLYGYVLYPWQYVQFNEDVFQFRFNILYAIENFVLVVSLSVLWSRTRQQWRKVYGQLALASILYVISSLLVNVGISQKTYFSGSIYDIPLTAAMAWFAYAAARAYELKPQPESRAMEEQREMYWHSALATTAMMFMPLMAIWAALNINIASRVQHFRFLFTLVVMMGMMALFFVKQMLLDRRLMSSLRDSRKAYEDLQQLQGHLLQAEKLAAIGRLVAGAAHEINNPLTAIVGYSDLLASHDKLDQEHKDFAEKILQQARRTKALVQNLLTFAKQTPLQRRAVNMNAIVGHALQLHELDFAGKNIQLICRMHSDLPHVVGDENQLLQVFLHIMNNAVDAMLEHSGGGTLVVSTDSADGRVLWTCSDTGPGVPDPQRIFDPFFTTKPVGKGTGLGLSASYGIIRDHAGHISCHNREEGGATFIISLPAADKPAPPEPPPRAQSATIQ